jgi:fumarate reductase subunit C
LPANWAAKLKKWLLPETYGMIGISKGAEVFLWSGRQAVFLLLMIVVCAMALAHPVWRHWYDLIVPPLLIIMAILALDYAMRK